MKQLTVGLILCVLSLSVFAQSNFIPNINFKNTASLPADTTPNMEWFRQAKLGIFIHYGIYAVNGISESWSFYNNQISYEDYMKQQKGFTASNYNPEEWAKLFVDAGAKYAVLTTKHHDGFALWDTKLSKLKSINTPIKKDLISPYCDALRKNGLKVGLYFSHLDWSHPDYASLRHKGEENKEGLNKFGHAPIGKSDPAKWENFLKFHRGQLKELSLKFKPDLFWFDGDWERDADQWRMKELRDSLHKWDPGVILNSRMRGYGDYKTPEQGLPVLRPSGVWELCMTINDSWGYQAKDTNFKSIIQLIRTFAEVIGMGGNLLLDVGPMADGTIPKPEVDRLNALGKWIKKNEPAIYSTTAGLPFGHFYGPTTLSFDKKRLFLFLFDTPKEKVYVKGLRNKIKSVKVLGYDKELTWERNGGASWENIPGILSFKLPAEMLDPYTTVISIEMEGGVDLYRNSGNAIESN